MTIKAVVLNGSLKESAEKSNTRALIDQVVQIFDQKNVNTEIIRLADYEIAYA